jgi:hypothetical protein
LEQIEASSGGMLDLEAAAMLMTAFQHKAAAAANGVSTTAKVPSPNILPTVAPSSGPRTT